MSFVGAIQKEVVLTLYRAKIRLFRLLARLYDKVLRHAGSDVYGLLPKTGAVELEALSSQPVPGANPCLDRNPFAGIDLQTISSNVGLTSLDLLRIPRIRHEIARRRWEAFKRKGKLQSSAYRAEDLLPETYEYNLSMVGKSLEDLSSLERPILLLAPLFALDQIRGRLSRCKLLTIGPRTEYEILLFLSYGFSLQNLTALDLFTYSPWIETGDMHAMGYADSSFDVIFLGWVFSYSTNMPKLAREVIRVGKPGGVVALGIDYTPPAQRTGERIWFDTSRDLLEYFSGSVGSVFFRHDPPPGDATQGNIRVIFELKK